MADEGRSQPLPEEPEEAEENEGMADVVADATVKALQEFDTGDMEEAAEQPQPTSSRTEADEDQRESRPESARSRSSAKVVTASGTDLNKGSERRLSDDAHKSIDEVNKHVSSLLTHKRASIMRMGAVERTKSRAVAWDDTPVTKESLKWGSDTALAVSKDEVIKSASDQDIEAPAIIEEDREIPLTPYLVKKTQSIMNVSRINLMEDMNPREKMMAILMDTESPEAVDTRENVSEDNLAARNWADDVHEAPVTYGHMAGGGDGDGGGDGGDDDGDMMNFGGDDDDDEEEDVEGDADGMDSDDMSDNETDMVVLDPDHPLMKRFQAALNAHLKKQNEKITLELRDLDETLRVKKNEREDLGVELYGVQQELARYQMLLEQNHDKVAALKQERQKEEQELTDVRELYKDSQYTVNKERKKGSELQNEVENLALRLFYMESSKEDVRSDIAVMRRAAEKVESEVARAEMEKQRQDLYVDRLVEKVDKLKEEIAMYEAQISAQSEETKAAKESLMEAYMEIEAIELEKKDLYAKWNSSLIGMRRRDEAHAAMQKALDQQEQHIQSLATEIEGFKKSIQKEQEQNEKLTLILNKTEREIELTRKHLTQVKAKHDALQAEFTTYTRMLHETEHALARATADKSLRTSEVVSLRKQIEQEYLAKIRLEDEILERMRTQLTLDKAAQYSKKLTTKTRDRTKHLEQEIADSENAIANASLGIVNVKTRIERLGKILSELDKKIGEQNALITKSEQEIVKRNAIIERKQNSVDIMNKKLNSMIAAAGGVELGPLEIHINSLGKSIEARNQELMELQQLWLRQQTELVRLSQTNDKEQRDLVACKRELTILSQKKIRTENDIEGQNREICDIERNIRNMRNDIIKLNTLLHKEKTVGDELEQGNVLMENAFVAGLKDAEMESIELQGKLDEIKDEKERLLNSLVEAERQIMLWEKKTQLARETRAAVDSEVGQGEMRAMKSEIHRMQVRYSQLMKQQEKMIQDMEKAVSRRDTILTRGDAQSKMQKKVVTKGTFERQMGELRKKIKHTIKEANECDNEIKELRDHQQGLSQQLEEKQVNCQQLQGASDTLDGDLDRTLEVKQKNLSELLARQQKMKYYQQVKEGKYTMLCKTPAALQLEGNKQEERLQALTAIVDRLNSEFPHAQSVLRKVTVTLASRAAPGDDA